MSATNSALQDAVASREPDAGAVPAWWSGDPFDPRLARVELLHQLFETQADLRPDAVAAICGRASLTYQQLNQRANQLARLLEAAGVKPGAAVGLFLPRGVDLYVAMLGILKAGAAYVPIDSECPGERVRHILADCHATAVVTTTALASNTIQRSSGSVPANAALRLIEMDRVAAALSKAPVDRPPTEVRESDRDRACYIIYTSGSTGRPKGVRISHRSACHLVRAEGKIFSVRPSDRVFQGFSVAFDASVEEIWLAFFAGATLVCGSSQMVRSGPDLSRLLIEAGVTVLSCVPTLLSMMSEDASTVRLLILGGEACPQDLARRWCRPGRRVVNTYGPTEATVIATYGELRADRAVTIGRPVPNYRVHILDEQQRAVPVNTAGELYIGGIGLAIDYVGRPDLTADKFVHLGVSDTNCGMATERLYRSGDLVRWTGTGEIEFLGRIDTQVKIRGFRIELTEIESAMMQCPGVLGAVASVRESAAGTRDIIGYITARAGQAVSEEVIRATLRTRLPSYMVPAAIEIVAGFPTLPSGKVDRSKLPEPPRARRDNAAYPGIAAQPVKPS